MIYYNCVKVINTINREVKFFYEIVLYECKD